MILKYIILKRRFILLLTTFKNNFYYYWKRNNLNECLWIVLSLFGIIVILYYQSDKALLFSISTLFIFINSVILLIKSKKIKCQYIDTPYMYNYCLKALCPPCQCKKDSLLWHNTIRKKWIKNSDLLIEKFVLWVVYNLYLRIDPIYNIIKWNYNPSPLSQKYQNIWIDIYLIIILALGIISYANINNDGNICEIFISILFVWRIITILLIKLNEILAHRSGGRYHNFNRSFIFLIINMIEVVVGYSFLYTSNHFNIIYNRNMEAIFKTLNIFTDWTRDNIGKLCLEQQLLILSQIVIFVILIMVFLASLSDFPFIKDNK